jgi:hypothetical protein
MAILGSEFLGIGQYFWHMCKNAAKRLRATNVRDTVRRSGPFMHGWIQGRAEGETEMGRGR